MIGADSRKDQEGCILLERVLESLAGKSRDTGRGFDWRNGLWWLLEDLCAAKLT